MTTRFTRSAFALSGIFALSLSMASPVAFAQEARGEEPGPAAAAAPVSVIDANKTGSINIHKFLFDNPTTPGTGEETAAPVGAKPLGGVKFKIEEVTLEKPLNTPDGFAAARKLTADSAPVTAGKSWEVTTTADGSVSQAGLKVGVYKVTELPVTDASAVTGLEKGKQLTAAAPFLVFIPMTDSTHTKWNYDVHVYPKNSETGATKEVSDAGKNVGDELTYTITGDIPVPGKGGKITKFVVTDELDSTKFAPAPTVAVSGKDINVDLTPDVDYKVEVVGTKVTVTFLDSGLAKLAKAKSEAIASTAPTAVNPQVVVTINAKVLPLGTNLPSVPNTATVVSNNGSTETDTTTPTNEVVSYFGKVRVNKVGEGDTPLDGAKFQLYTCGGTAEQPVLDGGPLTVNNKSEWVTADGGTLVIDSLHVTDFADNKEVSAPEKTYCLVETEAPAGYELLTQPFKFELKRADLVGDPKADGEPVMNTKTLQVTNVKSTTPNLPLTGGPGIIALVLAGLTLIGGGAWYGLRSTRKA